MCFCGKASYVFFLGKDTFQLSEEFRGYLFIVTLSGWDATHNCQVVAKLGLPFLTSYHNNPRVVGGSCLLLDLNQGCNGGSRVQEFSAINRKVRRSSVKGSYKKPPLASLYLLNL